MRSIKSKGLASIALIVGVAAAQACSGEGATEQQEPVQPAAGAIQVASAGGCTVEWVRFNYDTPGTDTGEFIELRVTNAGSSATTLGACGLSSIRLVSDSDCGTYNTINLASVAIPNDGIIVICDSTQITGGVCDVNVSAGAAGWLQNGAPDHLSFVAGNGSVSLHATYEGVSDCLPDGGAAATVSLLTEDNASPDMVNTWCNGAWVLQDVSISGAGTALNCATDAGADAEAGTDAGNEAAADATSDVNPDAPGDAASEAAQDATSDVNTDAASDAGSDATTDAA
ncbi:MAG: hypothetical protein DYH12_24890, partial [Sorangiineae bacterium PRO1]|nr:hypothetical protein [Sorangiineae bacterium PRO1]